MLENCIKNLRTFHHLQSFFVKSIFIVLFLSIIFNFNSCTFSSVEDYYNVSHVESGIEVTLSIDCKTILNNENYTPEKYTHIPKDGIILEKTKFLLPNNSSVYDLLEIATKTYKIQSEIQGRDLNEYGSVYVEGIANIYEFDFGNLSGWMYAVNDFSKNVGCDSCILNSGDEVKWLYTCDIGHDLDIHFQEDETYMVN